MLRLVPAPLVAVVHPHTPAVDLAASLLARGWTEGPPPHRQGAAIDRQVCRFRKCSCGRRGMTLRTFHRGPRYIGLAECPACGAGEEV